MANFTGTTGADIYAGTADDDTIHDGGGGADNLGGGDGNDAITVTGVGGTDTVSGGDGSDRLTLLWDAAASTSGITLSSITGSLAAGYSGLFDGAGSNNVSFSGIEHFTVIDLGPPRPARAHPPRRERRRGSV